MKEKIIIFGFLVLAFFIGMSGCTQSQYRCPDLSKLDFDKDTNTYIQWVDCMPFIDEPLCEANAAKEYKQWINQNCGIKLELKFAV